MTDDRHAEALDALKSITQAQLELSMIARNIVERADSRSGFTWPTGILLELRSSATAVERCLRFVRDYLIREYDRSEEEESRQID